jgi:hypothetical protein
MSKVPTHLKVKVKGPNKAKNSNWVKGISVVQWNIHHIKITHVEHIQLHVSFGILNRNRCLKGSIFLKFDNFIKIF